MLFQTILHDLGQVLPAVIGDSSMMRKKILAAGKLINPPDGSRRAHRQLPYHPRSNSISAE